jgi:hypothetical protein
VQRRLRLLKDHRQVGLGTDRREQAIACLNEPVQSPCPGRYATPPTQQSLKHGVASSAGFDPRLCGIARRVARWSLFLTLDRLRQEVRVDMTTREDMDRLIAEHIAAEWPPTRRQR